MTYRSLLCFAFSGVLAPAAFAHVFVYEGLLSGLNESPPNASPGTGFTRVTVDVDLFTMRVEATFSGLLGVTTASHIHVRPNSATPNGGVATQLPSFTGFPLGVTAGSYDHTFDMAQASSYNPSFITNNGGTVTLAFNALFAALNTELAYLNVHTQTFPGGELRGNLVLVPEPATMSILGLGVLSLLRSRRARAR